MAQASTKNEPKFARQNKNFWSHYDAAHAWMKFHRLAVEAAYGEAQLAYSKASSRARDEKEVPETCEASCSDEQNLLRDVDKEPEEGETEMSPAMAEFFRQTIEHRRQRDAKRIEEMKAEAAGSSHWAMDRADEYIPADKIGIYGISQRTVATPNVASEHKKKKAEMQRLYGPEAEKIAAMETSLDMRFEQYFDRYNPQLWPIIPLKF